MVAVEAIWLELYQDFLCEPLANCDHLHGHHGVFEDCEKVSEEAPQGDDQLCVGGEGEEVVCEAQDQVEQRWERRGGGSRLRRSRHLQKSKTKDPSIFKSYNEDLEKERQVDTQQRKDTNRLRSVGGKVSLPHELSKIIHPENRAKDDGFNLLSAFQGLSFGPAALTERRHSKASTPTATTCIVM
ncbi:hypothetical protein F7725_018416 [Dissostichus mawsoni]|uniref:Uncharacterized protein n=1 Tax=Dissostichus mawsoni TaxID=36200 RepID=A0A7J5XT14_DISMA|nr:hypothetical protein F7725_018416 [Dissostichus mawsoni]